jgi:hypothetical protein
MAVAFVVALLGMIGIFNVAAGFHRGRQQKNGIVWLSVISSDEADIARTEPHPEHSACPNLTADFASGEHV